MTLQRQAQGNVIAPVQLTPDKSRLPLPKALTDRIDWLAHEDVDTAGWLLLVGEGRFRMLSDEEVTSHPHLDSLRALIQQGRGEDEKNPVKVFPHEESALPARLLRVSFRTHTTGWRMSWPDGVRLLFPIESGAQDLTVLFTAEGFWEIWDTRILRRALAVPIPLGATS
jgi:hypothetical protein